jgi:hypothetical protein
MKKSGWKITAAIGLMVFSQIGSAMSGSRAAIAAGNSTYLAQADQPAATTVAPIPDSKGAQDPSPAGVVPPSPTTKAAVVKPAPGVAGCGLKYLTAEISGKLKGRKWKQFRDEECGATISNAVFPTAIAPKYAKEDPDKARTSTCADQFTANKATHANDGLKWIEKGGGYYSECVSRLKGS